jgi:hypothetical protein
MSSFDLIAFRQDELNTVCVDCPAESSSINGMASEISESPSVGKEAAARSLPNEHETQDANAEVGRDDRLDLCMKAMMKIQAKDRNDGSNRLLSAARQCVRYDLTDEDALIVFRRYSAAFPFQVQWSNADFVRRLRDAEKRVERGDGLEQAKRKKSRSRSKSNGDYDPKGRIEIEITTEEDVINEAVAQALANDPELFSRGGFLAMIGEENGNPVICEVPEATVRDRIAARVQFYTSVDDGDGDFSKVPQHPPTWNVKATAARRRWGHLRPLLGVVTTPTIRPDGSLLDVPGYDPVTRLVYAPGKCTMNIPSQPTREEALKARDLLMDIVCDFPFKADAHRATWLAYQLTLLGRFAYDGPAPLSAFDGTVAGTGKSLLADISFTIAFGTKADRFTNPTNDEEARKRITSLALSGASAVLIDNVAGVFGSPSLDAALTATSWGDRLLGKNQDVRIPLRVVWAATANNLILRPDTARRVAHIRMESPEEQPEFRAGFKYPKLIQHVTEHRAELLAAGLTILRAWFHAGKPEQNLAAWGSYEGWSAIIRHVIVWLDLPDPACTREEFRAEADRETEAFHELLAGLLEADPQGYGLEAAELVERVERDSQGNTRLRNALLELCSTPNGKLSAKSVGRKLASLRGRLHEGRCIDHHQRRGDKKGWYVRCKQTESSPDEIKEF